MSLKKTTEFSDSQILLDSRTNRIVYPDVIRIIAVITMIMLHAAAVGFERFGARTVYWQVCNIYEALTRFCVPVFVMVSGIFLLAPEREYDLKKLYCKKILRIVTAYLFWATFYSLFSLIDLLVQNRECSVHECIYTLVRGIVKGHFHLWFLYMICGLYIVTPFLRLIVKDEKLTIYFLTLGLIFVYLTKMANLLPHMSKLLAATIKRMNVHLVAGYSCYFILGYWLSRHKLSSSIRKKIYFLGFFSVIGTAIVNGLISYHYNVPGTWLYNYNFLNILLVSTAVFVFCQYHFEKELAIKWQRYIALVGRWSFGIYLVHAFFLRILDRLGFPDSFGHPIFSIPITTIIVFFSSLFIVFILDKIPILNKYIM